MTRTEDRLADAVTAAARGIRAETIRPLAVPQRPRRRVPGWLVPAAAAMSVVAAIGLGFALPRLAESPRPFADVGTAASPPPFYVTTQDDMSLRVWSTATGRVTAGVPTPGWSSGGTVTDAVAGAAASGRLFVVAYHDWDGRRTLLYRFSLTSSGRVAGYAPVPGGALPGLRDLTVAVSPAGSQVAVGGIPDDTAGGSASGPALIFVINLHTGARKALGGGMNRPGAQFTVASLSWERNGRSLVFLALWCRSMLADPYNVTCESSGPVPHQQAAQLWEVGTAHAGRLSAGHMLLGGPRRYQGMAQAVISPDGRSATVLGRHGKELALAAHSIPAGRVLGEVHHLRSPRALLYARLTSDGSGRYLMLTEGFGSGFGWLGNGRFHAIAQHGVVVISAAW